MANPTFGKQLIHQGILSKGHVKFWRRLGDQFREGDNTPVDWEALLMEADLGVELAIRLATEIEDNGFERDFERGSAIVRDTLRDVVKTPPPVPVPHRPEVLLLIGVNGSGKTTTSAKLAHRAIGQGKKVMFAACDTFRAAAVEQIEVWGERLKIPVVRGQHGQDPASVAFQAHEKARAEEVDLLIVDTAGRQANKANLMAELAKVKRVLGKLDKKSPHHTWLVVDANTGNNISLQAGEFHKGVGLDGMIMTKLDGSGKGGMVAAVRQQHNLPTYFLGRGEQPQDLQPFRADAFVDEFFS